MSNDINRKINIITNDLIIQNLAIEINTILDKLDDSSITYMQSEAMLRRMISNIAHDIKTPLTVVIGLIEFLMLRGQPNEQHAEILNKIKAKANQVSELMNHFFYLAKLESNDINTQIVIINLNEVCRNLILEYYDILNMQQFEVLIDIPEDIAYINGNEDFLNRIFNNLISNAIRHGKEGEYLGFLLRTDEYFVYVDVVDKGKGIPKASFESIFERMYVLEDSRSNSFAGSGLGLAITKKLLEKLQGEVILHSIPNEKTIFTVKFQKINY